MDEKCKRCLLFEAGDDAALANIKSYLENIDEGEKVSKTEYSRRLQICKSCECLIAGVCFKCGCYVELRAALKDKNCPNYDNRQW